MGQRLQMPSDLRPAELIDHVLIEPVKLVADLVLRVEGVAEVLRDVDAPLNGGFKKLVAFLIQRQLRLRETLDELSASRNNGAPLWVISPPTER